MAYWVDLRNNLDKIYDVLQDDESRDWFDARVEYMLKENSELYIDKIFKLNKIYPKKWRCIELEHALGIQQEIIIYGCGYEGKIIKRFLELCGYHILCWCDSNKKMSGTYIEGKRVISFDELLPEYKDCLVIIGSKKYELEIRRNLFDISYPVKNIFTFAYGTAICGKQYFDIFLPQNNEVFVDAGAYNGDSINEFMKWCKVPGGGTFKIYALELLEDMCDVLKNKNISNLKVVNCAVWNKNEDLFLGGSQRSSGIRENGTDIIKGRTIDSITEGDKVTFIKMDIEGAELKALEGASNTIKKNHPRLAICIYHKPTDLYDIGSYLLELNPNYKFYIRHYTTCMWETVLYADE